MACRFVNGRYLMMALVVILGVAIGVVIKTVNYRPPVAQFHELPEAGTTSQPPAEVSQPEPAETESAAEPTAARSYPLPAIEPAEPDPQDLLVEYTLTREQSRSAQLELLKEVASDPESSPIVKQEAQKRILDLARLQELEVNLVGLLQSQGFTDPVVVASSHGVTISLGNSLTSSEAAAVGNLVAKLSGIDPEKIVILERGTL
ncbi:MAG: SpoIIIAH-like family protein [Firmicutes bacterium]|nr:SpoIIIAH-like family protein [Bacillota bacterium]